MLKTYRIIPVVFILFLFGFTLITVSPVIAEDSPAFITCYNIDPSSIPKGGGMRVRLMKKKIMCLEHFATVFQDQLKAHSAQSGGEVAELNAKIAELNAENATLREQQNTSDAFSKARFVGDKSNCRLQYMCAEDCKMTYKYANKYNMQCNRG